MQGRAVSLKTRIMDVATRLFSQKGFRYTAISEIAKAAGAAEGTIFHHFKSKEGLFLEVLKELRAGSFIMLTKMSIPVSFLRAWRW